MKSVRILVLLVLVVVAISSCGRRDRCPSVGKVNTIEHTVVS